MGELIKFHLGCGPHIFPGWENFDMDPGPGGHKRDLRSYLSVCKSDFVDFIFTEHFIEHLTLDEGRAFLRECYRILKPGGVIRVSTPDLRVLIEDYRDEHLIRMYGTWEPATLCQMVNEGMRSWGHQFLYDHQELAKQLYEAGFPDISGNMQWHNSFHPELCNLEVRPDRDDLIVEARKP